MHPDGPGSPGRSKLPRLGRRTSLGSMFSGPSSVSTEAREILDQDHAHLSIVKDRILEFLGVRKLREDSRGPILCFAGPPGVGKTSASAARSRAPWAASSSACVARRRARRSRDPRPSPHLRRRTARSHHPGTEAGRHEQPGDDARRARQARARISGAIPPRRCSRSSIPSRTRTSATTS